MKIIDNIKKLIDRLFNKSKVVDETNYKEQGVDNRNNVKFLFLLILGIILFIILCIFIFRKNYARETLDKLTENKYLNYSYVDVAKGTILTFDKKVKITKSKVKINYEILSGKDNLLFKNNKYYINKDTGTVKIKYKASCFGIRCRDERIVTYEIKPMCDELYNKIVTIDNYSNNKLDKDSKINVLNMYKNISTNSKISILSGSEFVKVSFDENGKYIIPIKDGKFSASYDISYNKCTTVLNKKYKINFTKYNVKFNSKGGSKVETEKIVIGEKALKPIDPIKEQYIFEGWTLNKQNYDFNTPVTKDIELIAKWSPGFKLTININGGEMPRGMKEINYLKSNTTYYLKNPTRKDYDFIGWSASTSEVSNNTYIMPSKDVTITAMWKLKKTF